MCREIPHLQLRDSLVRGSQRLLSLSEKIFWKGLALLVFSSRLTLLFLTCFTLLRFFQVGLTSLLISMVRFCLTVFFSGLRQLPLILRTNFIQTLASTLLGRLMLKQKELLERNIC